MMWLRILAAASWPTLLVTADPAQPDVVITTPPISYTCLSSSCWIGVADGTTLFLESPFVVPFDAHLRLSPWPLLGRASLVAVNGSQLGLVQGALSLEALDLFGSVLRADSITDGGCIAAAPGARLNVTNSSFNSCATFGSGGALSIGEEAHAHLRDIRAVNGVAFDEGGFIYAAHNASVIIDGASVLSLAYATSGGLISIGPFATLDISGSTVLSNGTVEQTGGIIKASLGARVTVRNAALLEFGGAQQDGGCVYADSGGIIEIQDNATLRFCLALSNGGGINSMGTVSLSGNVVVSDCKAVFGGSISMFGTEAVVDIREAAQIVSSFAFVGGGVATFLEARVMLRDYARITECTASAAGGGIYGENSITLVGDAVISHCSALYPNSGQGGGIYGVDRALVELRDRAKVVQCQAQGAGGCIYAVDTIISDHAHVGNCTATNLVGSGFGGCFTASSRIVMRDFATLSQCYADSSGAFSFIETGTIVLSGNALVSDCTAVTSGAVVFGLYNTTVVLQDNATIARAYSGSLGTFFLQGDSTLLMMGRASIYECVADSGSAVYADKASLAIHGENKIVNCRGAAYFAQNILGRISLSNGATLTANGMLIRNCSAYSVLNGGGIYAFWANVALYDVVLEACSAQSGGAVSASNASLKMENVRIVGCSAVTSGGGIFLNMSEASIYNSALQNNHAGQGGGCIYARTRSLLVATNTTLERCSGSVTAGGIEAREWTDLALIDVHVRECWSSGYGGGAAVTETINLQLHGSTTISSCYAATWGGGIYGRNDVRIEFSDRASIVDTVAGISGGGCYLQTSSVLVMRDVTSIVASRAGSGGGCSVKFSSILMLLDHASIVSAHADDNGGGVFASDGSIAKVFDAAFITNSSAGANGGAIAAQASTVYLRGRVVISRNRASLDGGGIALEDASRLFASSSRCRWVDFNVGFMPASALISTGGARLNKPDALGQSMLVQLSSSKSPAIQQFCLSTNEMYNLEAYSPDARGWSGANATVSSDPELANASTGIQVLGFDITLTVKPGEHAVVQQFVVPHGKPGQEGAPLLDSNEARRGGALAQLQGTKAFIEGTSFRSNAATSESSKDGGGGACFLHPLGVLTAHDTSFHKNSATSTGGAVDALPNSVIFMLRVSATGNKASGSGGFARLDSASAGTAFQQCALSRNEARGQAAEGGAMLIVDVPSEVAVPLRNVTFQNNYVDGTNSAGGALAVRASNVNLGDVHFLANEARLGDGGALALLDTSESTVSIISNEGCAKVTIEIDFRFTLATCLPLEGFEELPTCDSILSGCAAYQSFADNARIWGVDAYTAFLSSLGLEDVYADSPTLAEYNAFVSRLNRTATACAGCGCWRREERYIVLRNSSSQIARATPRAAAIVEYEYCLTPGIYTLQAYDELGESWWNGTYRLVANGRVYAGPNVIGYKSSQLALTIGSDDAALPPSTMEKNNATSGAGGAVFIDDGVTDQKPLGLAENVNGLETNAAYYGSVVASPARRLQAAAAGMVQAKSGYEIAAGSLTVELIDAFDQRCTSIGQEVGAVGSVSSPSTITNNLAVFAKGVATFDRAILALHPGSTLVVNVSSSLSTLLVSQVTFLVVLALCFEGTIETAVSSTTSRCVPCDVGNYWWDDRCHKCREGMDCSESGLTLIQVPVYKRRYRTTPTSKYVYKCPSKGSGCPGGRATGEASCATGYTGVLCAACEKGYYLKPPGGDGRIRCGHCDNTERRTARATLVVSGILVFFAVSLLLLTSCGQECVGWILAEPGAGELGDAVAEPHPGQSPQNVDLQLDLGHWDRWHFGSGLVKLKEIFAIYQMLAAMRDMFGNNFEVPSVYAAFSMFMSLFGLDLDRVLPIRCLFQNLSSRLYYIHRLVVIETLPFAAAAILFTIALIGRTFKGRFQPYIHQPSYRITVQLAFFFVHITAPTCTFAAISSLVCDKYDYGEEDSKRFLRVATDIDCDSPVYRNRIYPLGVFSVLIFPTAVIIAYATLLYCFRSVLNNTDTHWDKFVMTDAWAQNVVAASEPQEVVKKSLYYQRSAAVAREPDDAAGREMWFQFLWSGYRPDCYMFELVDMSKRIFFTALLSLFWPGSRLQITLALLVAICFIDFYTRYRPFLHRGDELLALSNNWVLAVSQLVGLMINAGIGFSKESIAAKALLVGAACVPIVVFVYVLRWWFYSTMLVPFVDFFAPKLITSVIILRGLPSATYDLSSTTARAVTRYCKDVMHHPVNTRDLDIEMKVS